MSIEVMDRVWKHSKAKSGALLTLLAIADNADAETCEAYPGIDHLSKKTRLSRSGVKDATKRLIELGELEVVERGGYRQGVARANRYRILLGPYGQIPDIGDTKGQFAAHEGPDSDPQPSVEPSVKEVNQERPDDLRAVTEVFAHWKAVMGKSSARLTPNRRQKIKTRLSEGYTVADLCRAVDGCAGSDFHMGREPGKGGPFNDLTLICRSVEKVEQFMGLPVPGESSDDGWFGGEA